MPRSARFDVNARRLRNNNVRQGDVEARFVPLLLFFITLAVGLLHAILLFRMGLLNTGDVVAYFGILLLLDFPTWTSIWAYSQISSGSGRRPPHPGTDQPRERPGPECPRICRRPCAARSNSATSPSPIRPPTGETSDAPPGTG